MATHDYIISNASGAAVRADLNNALAAIVSNNSNATSPATTYAFQFWADTTTGQLKIRNAANSAWITLMELDGTMLMEDGTVSAPGLAFASDLNTGFFRSAADKINFATNGAERLEIGDSEVVFNDPSNDVDFRVESNGNANMLFVDGGNDRVGVGIGTPTSVLDVRDTQTGAASEIKLFNLDQGNTTTQTSALVMTPDLRANGAKISVVKENADFSSSANKDVAITFSPVSNNTATERMRIDSSGKVGIGTTSPQRALVVSDAGDEGFEFFPGSSDTGNTLNHYDRGSSAFIDITTNADQHIFGRADGEKVRIDGSGRLLVGTSSSTGNTNADDLQIGARNDSGERGITVASSVAGSIRFADDGNDTAGYIFYSHSDNSLRLGTDGSERVRLGSSGNLGIGCDNPQYQIDLSASDVDHLFTGAINAEQDGSDYALKLTALGKSGGRTGSVRFITGQNTSSGSEVARFDSSGRLLVGTSSTIQSDAGNKLQIAAVDGAAGIVLGRNDQSISSGNTMGSIGWWGNDTGSYQECAQIRCDADGDHANNDKPSRLVFSTCADNAGSVTERMRISSNGDIHIGRTGNSRATIGYSLESAFGVFGVTSNTTRAIDVNRQGNDGDLILFFQANSQEGSISVSGTTVSYNGAHLSRWSQLAGGAERTEILRGSVLSNLDEMCEWAYEAQDAVLYTEEDELPEGVSVGDVKTPAVAAGTEDNEQLNRMKVSDVEGDVNVSGVFQAWDDDDDTYTNDFYCAMTGDFVIRIAQGTTVARGDLLMSAGDGTAKPQDDDIVRSKTIAKVTSTTVSTTYSDGSYCVPCVLMAC